jgi:hypothetical protein
LRKLFRPRSLGEGKGGFFAQGSPQKQLHTFMRRSIPHACVVRRLNSLHSPFSRLVMGASTPENINLFLGEPLWNDVAKFEYLM